MTCCFQAKDSKAKDYEDFLDDLVEDFEVRAKINLFKDPEGLAQAAAAKADREGAMDGDENADDEPPEVSARIFVLYAIFSHLLSTGECGRAFG
jgi:hypothetical protein